MAENQKPRSLYYSSESRDSLDLTNYTDQIFNTSIVEQIAVPLVTKTDEDIKFDNKLNVNFDNISTPGLENLRAMFSPSDNSTILDLAKIEENQNIYTVEESGYINLYIEHPVENDFIQIKNTNNNHTDYDYFITGKQLLSVQIPVAKYQVINISWNKDTSSTKTCILIPLGTESNVGESLIYTRDYKSLMANIGFPDLTNVKNITLPPNKSSIVFEEDGYYSLAITPQENEYINISTQYYGSSIKYSLNNKTQFIFLQVAANTPVYFEYELLHNPDYIVFIPPIGRSGL